ncbi:hypothetical protein Pyn_06003 [Prunus yedoensis var. nudiflora]|uniref:Uncharacterized protein n=1 Tax=Prunus yedoensis var. nudiflora TaxID=2094558 RepID=A0A314ZAQ8_PRUYE|nr:hypothetical protein Pyn_06003 [Prunus yedoensis var. nudiflora]
MIHWNPSGTLSPQALRSKLIATGMFRLMPKILALMAVQRHTEASRSMRPKRIVQQGLTGTRPTLTLTNPPSTSAQTPNCRASLGQA